jgi:hypothetical protein
MATFSDIRTIPGLYGGGFGRVVDVQRLTGGRVSLSDAPQDALVRLERLADPLKTFQQNVQQFFGDAETQSRNALRLSGDMLTLLQQIDAEQREQLGPQLLPPLGPQLPPLGAQPERPQAQDDEQNTTAVQDTDEQTQAAFEQALQRQDEAQPFGPDLIAQLDALLNRPPIEVRTTPVSFGEVNGSAPNLSSNSASLAAQAYAVALGNSPNNELSLTV